MTVLSSKADIIQHVEWPLKDNFPMNQKQLYIPSSPVFRGSAIIPSSDPVKAAQCTNSPYAWDPGKSWASKVYCTQSSPAFLVSIAWICDLLAAWQQLYQLHKGSPSPFKVYMKWILQIPRLIRSLSPKRWKQLVLSEHQSQCNNQPNLWNH